MEEVRVGVALIFFSSNNNKKRGVWLGHSRRSASFSAIGACLGRAFPTPLHVCTPLCHARTRRHAVRQRRRRGVGQRRERCRVSRKKKKGSSFFFDVGRQHWRPAATCTTQQRVWLLLGRVEAGR
jgi:hypothetical protein